MLTVVDLPESTWPMTTTLMWFFSSLLVGCQYCCPGARDEGCDDGDLPHLDGCFAVL